MYSPTLGRFITKDPIGFQAGDVNLYRFVGNHPTNTTDPSGLAEPPYPDKLGAITESFANETTSDAGLAARVADGGVNAGGRAFYIKMFGNEAKPGVISPEQWAAVPKEGTNIQGGFHAFFGWPQATPVKYFGTAGCKGCVGLIVVCDRSVGAIFHFSANDSATATLDKYDWPKIGKCKAYVFGGDDTAVSKGLFRDVYAAAAKRIGRLQIYVVDSDQLLVGYDGKIWVRPPTGK